MNNTIENPTNQTYQYSGLFALSLRIVVGWTYFSAFWRRLILEDKLNPELPGYIGEKFNHFLPNALGIKPMIEFMVSNPETLWWSMLIFTIIEAIVGLFILLGLFTRLMSIGVFSLAMGILLGAGWIGTTCLDEWQIGILGLATGFTLFFTGGGPYSTDSWLSKKYPAQTNQKWFSWFSSGILPLENKILHKLVLTGTVFILFVTLMTNQVFHGGLWGKLHNKSVRPDIEISNTQLKNDKLNFEVFRVEGVDVYGSFLIAISLVDEQDNIILNLDGEDLANFPLQNISNEYIAKVKPGKHSLVIPLGAKATLSVKNKIFQTLASGKYELVLTDISGLNWSSKVLVD